MKALYLLAASLFFASVSCEKHDWEETKILHDEHGHGEAHGDAHATDAPGAPGEEGGAAAH